MNKKQPRQPDARPAGPLQATWLVGDPVDPAASLDLFRDDGKAELLLECASDGAADRVRLPVEDLDEA